MSGVNPYEYINVISHATGPRSVRESEEMTIYDMFRHIVTKVAWDGMDFNEENQRKEAATRLIDRLEEVNFFGQLGLDIKEEM